MTSLFIEILFDATRIGIHSRLFAGIISSPKITKNCPWWNHFLIKIQGSTSWNTTNLCDRSFHESAFKYLQQKFQKHWEKYVVELSFSETVLQMLFWKWSQRSRYSKRSLCIASSFFSNVKGLQCRNSNLNKNRLQEKYFWECSEIARKLAWKRSTMKLFY